MAFWRDSVFCFTFLVRRFRLCPPLSIDWIRVCKTASPWFTHTLGFHQSARIHRPQPRNDACHHRRLERRKEYWWFTRIFCTSEMPKSVSQRGRERECTAAAWNVLLLNEKIAYIYFNALSTWRLHHNLKEEVQSSGIIRCLSIIKGNHIRINGDEADRNHA